MLHILAGPINWEHVSAERIAYWRMRMEYAPAEVHRFGIDRVEAEYQKRAGYPAHLNKGLIEIAVTDDTVTVALKAGTGWTACASASNLSGALLHLAREVEQREALELTRLSKAEGIPELAK